VRTTDASAEIGGVIAAVIRKQIGVYHDSALRATGVHDRDSTRRASPSVLS
jgi:hypothetical protein